MMADIGELLAAARAAAERYAWSEAFGRFGEADAVEPLGPDDLELMAECAWWIGKMRHCIALRERAHAAYLQAGKANKAARVAIELADSHTDLLEPSVASAWLQRASRILDKEPESIDHAWLKIAYSIHARQVEGDLVKSNALAAEANEMAARYGDKDLFALTLALQGTGMIFLEQDIDGGMAMIEEATVGAVSGELGPYATGWIYCMMITVSAHLADWQRAGHWTEAAKRWCDRQAINGFPGVCRVHRAEIMRLRGSLSEAEEEARTATVELGSFNLFFSALAFRELGDVRLRMGDLEAAEDAYRQANEMGVSPQPGLAQAQLLRGKPKAAASSMKRALGEGMPPLERAKLLPTQLEAALALGDIDTGRAAAAELAEIAASHKSPALVATAEASAAAVGLIDGDLPSAEASAKRASRLYKETDLPYEAARVSLTLGQIYEAEGDTEAAQFEISSALSAFERMGAVPDADRARDLLRSLTPSSEPIERRVAKTFLFSDIVKSTNLVEAIGDEAWSDLLKWHDDTLRKLFAEHGGEEVVHTGDGFFIAFEDAQNAAACAVAIQRSLADHRRAHGFSPQVRIGLHATEAAEVKGNYHGKGVHEAARIGALAEGAEIVVSASTLDCLSSKLPATNERTVELKGVAEPVRVFSLDWRSG
jgi:class 3 adenylate cyclase